MNTLSITLSNTPIRQDLEGRFCLNDLHKAAGNHKKHRPGYFLETQQAQELITEMTDAGIPSSEQNQPVKVFKGGNSQQGTFAVKELVYTYAMWISPKFHIAVIRAYDALVTGQLQPVVPGPMTLNQFHDRQMLINAAQQAMLGVQVTLSGAELLALKITPAFMEELRSPTADKPSVSALIIQLAKDGNTRAEIAARLDLSRNNVRQQLFNARRDGLLSATECLA